MQVVYFIRQNIYNIYLPIPTNPMKFRQDIQGLRALAVLSVFIFHLNHNFLSGGFLGVDIFFVISGFLISGIILNKIDKKEFSFIDFYQSRFKRIVPAYYFLLIVVSVAVLFIYFNQDVKFFRKGLFYSAIFNSNNYFSTLDTYFGAQNSENPLLHTWTLAVEMQFYLILPILLWVFRKKTLVWVILLLTILSLIYAQIQIVHQKQVVAMYYSLPARSCEFFIGVLAQIFICRKQTNKISKNLQNVLSTIGLLLILVSFFVFNEKTLFPGFSAMIPCIGTGFLLISYDSLVNKVLSNKFFVFIGQISYSVYLWHWPFMALYRYYYSQYEIPLIHGIIMTVLIFGFSCFSYYFVEEFWRKKSNKFFWIGAIPALGVIALFVISMVSVNEKMGVTPAEFSSSTVMGLESHGKYFENVELIGDIKSKDKILMLGDSHGLVMKPFLNYIGSRNNFTVATITNDTYPPVPGINKAQFTEQSNYHLYEKLATIAEKEIEKHKVIIIIKSWKLDFPYFNEALEKIIEKHPDKYFLVLSDFPVLNKNPIRINRGAIRDKSRNTKFKSFIAKIPDDVQNNLKTSPNAFLLDLTDSKVFDNAPYWNDTVIYYDENHLNKFGSEKYAEESEGEFIQALHNLTKN